MSVQFCITHRCNKMCDLCGQFLELSDYDMTIKQMKYNLSQLKPETKVIQLTGGEPLTHPKYETIFRMCIDHFSSKTRIGVMTNGVLIPKVSRDIFERCVWGISEYPGWNDKIVKKYRNKKNVKVRRWKQFWDVNVDPNLSEQEAKRVSKNCYHNVRVVGTDLYRCCNSEAIERKFNTDPVHKKFTKNWRDYWLDLPVWKTCQHCFHAVKYTSKLPRIHNHK